MENSDFKTPVLLIAFNRPETTARVFDIIRKVRPRELFFALDGSRDNRPDDKERIAQTQALIKQIDWPSEVQTLFQEKNLGSGLGPVTAINWFFETVSEGIILEDDCIPDPSFFYFCQELLDYYRDSEKVMHISGDNFQNGKKRGDASYYFSKYTHNWGWATWRRAWKHNDFEMLPPEARRHIWDKQWLKSVERQGGLAILPNVNLVTNIGSGEGATHTSQEANPYLHLLSQSMTFPLVHPKTIHRDVWADLYTYRTLFEGTLSALALQKMLHAIPSGPKKIVKRALGVK